MSLPYKFKFKTIAENSITYTATVKEGALYYEWNGGSAYWDLIDAERLTTFGTWIITEVIQHKEDIMEQTIKQMEATVAELLAKAEELKQLIEKEKQKEDVWPEDGDAYYNIDSCGEVGDSRWDNDEWDEARMEIGNVFRTKEDAEKALAKRKIETKLRTLAEKAWKESGTNINWNDFGQQKWGIYFNHRSGKFSYEYSQFSELSGATYFPTQESAYDAVKEIGEDNLKLLFM